MAASLEEFLPVNIEAILIELDLLNAGELAVR
jgi:hypothetical protein